MSHLYLPTEHTDTDLALASAVAEAIDSNELFVAWTYDNGAAAAPEVQALLLKPEPAARSPFAEAMGEIVAAFAAFLGLFLGRSPRRAADRPSRMPASRSELEG